MKIKFWGVRGSLPSPITGHAIREKIKKILMLAKPSDILEEKAMDMFLNSLPFSYTGTYGGNTTCLEIRNRNNDILIIDAGTGIRELGNLLMKENFGKGQGLCHFLFTHTHWDHIQGLPFFAPIYIKGNEFHFHGISENLESRLRYQNNFAHFPVAFDSFLATKYFHQYKEGEEFHVYNFTVTSKALRHPGTSYAYKIQEEGKTFIFASDAEFRLDDMDIQCYIDFFSGADVLVMDTQYTLQEQLIKIDWGHSSANIAVDIALKAGVKTLILFHHDPAYSDEMLDEILMKAMMHRDIVNLENKELNILIAYEGLEITL